MHHPAPQVLKSALQIVAAERGIKNAAAVAAAHAQQQRNNAAASRAAAAASRGRAASPQAPPAKRFAAAGPANSSGGGDGSLVVVRPVPERRHASGELALSPRASGASAALNNAFYPVSSGLPPSASVLHSIPSASTFSRGGTGGGFEPQRSTVSVSRADNGGAAPGLPEAIADVSALEVSLRQASAVVCHHTLRVATAQKVHAASVFGSLTWN